LREFLRAGSFVSRNALNTKVIISWRLNKYKDSFFSNCLGRLMLTYHLTLCVSCGNNSGNLCISEEVWIEWSEQNDYIVSKKRQKMERLDGWNSICKITQKRLKQLEKPESRHELDQSHSIRNDFINISDIFTNLSNSKWLSRITRRDKTRQNKTK
jgi:hypothetical protein